MAAKKERDECPVCCETFTKQTRAAVPCSHCDYRACQQCYRTYTLTTANDAHCMQCRAVWSPDKLHGVFPVAFLNDDAYKTHRRRVLLDRERALLPGTQQRAANLKRVRELRAEVANSVKRVQDLRALTSAAKRAKDRAEHEAHRLAYNGYRGRTDAVAPPTHAESDGPQYLCPCPASDCRGFVAQKDFTCGTCASAICKQCGTLEQQADDAGPASHVCDPDTVASFEAILQATKPCPKCAVRIHRISGCFAPHTPILMHDTTVKPAHEVCVGDVLMGDDGVPRRVLRLCAGEDAMYDVRQAPPLRTYRVNSKHTLVLQTPNLDTVLITVDAYLGLTGEARAALGGTAMFAPDPTPMTVVAAGRGRYVGFETDGNHRFVLPDTTVVHNCNQMYCVQCNTAFGWADGKVEHGVVHNPHYFEFLRARANGGAIPRQPGDDPCAEPAGGGVPASWRVTDALKSHAADPKDAGDLVEILQRVLHAQHVVLPTLRQICVEDNAPLRMRFLLNEITEEEFADALHRREKKRDRDVAVRDILDTIVAVAGDVYTYLLTAEANVQDCADEMRAMREYAKTCLAGIKTRFGMAVFKI